MRFSGPCVIQGREADERVLGPLLETDPTAPHEVLADSLARHGYLFVRGLLDGVEIEAARAEVFGRLAEVGEILEPVCEGIFSGVSHRAERVNLGEFWRSVSQGTAIRRVSHGDRIRAWMQNVFGEPAAPHDYLFLRPGVVGRATHLHFDRPFFARGSQRVLTVWSAVGDIPVSEGPLFVVERGHCFEDLLGPVREIDYDSSAGPQVQLTQNAAAFAASRGARLLAADFRAGDVIVFGMEALHGTFDNCSPIGRTRLSSDVRWQPLADPFDPRYMGEDPPGTTGAGYGELNGAKPLTQDWHTR
ncbi:MAG: phytanoyl-CoA dioxygenase family protein [Pirellulaceae bacterium]|jgi:hypothetical protein|nr:phytanoyl-CoA dioxygenase family protein [Pirellulaceae bacterium]MDP7015695.1 phytanoyl-CoA dioxygenase family protein [Pirellulaceae bacterium]